MSVIKRAFIERRSGRDRRIKFCLGRFFYKGSEKRCSTDRRLQIERRDGWVRISKWSSVSLPDLKIARFLK
jgi:hypothetical protein